MCGIGFSLITRNALNRDGYTRNYIDGMKELLSRRGPDDTEILNVIAEHYNLSFVASVLHIQGDSVAKQPFVDIDGNILLWNGEIFSGLSTEDSLDILSDTVHISLMMRNCLNGMTFPVDDSLSDASKAISLLFSPLCGPFAFIYYYKKADALFYGRDRFGRRSLLQSIFHNLDGDGQPIFSVCSVGVNDMMSQPTIGDEEESGSPGWAEVPVTGIFALQLNKTTGFCQESSNDLSISIPVPVLIPWDLSTVRLGRFGSSSHSLHSQLTSSSIPSAEKLFNALLLAVQCRVRALRAPARRSLTSPEVVSEGDECRIGVLFSGGIDSVVLAAFLHLSLDSESRYEEPIDLINVTFEGPIPVDDDLVLKSNTSRLGEDKAPDRMAAILALSELQVGRILTLVYKPFVSFLTS